MRTGNHVSNELNGRLLSFEAEQARRGAYARSDRGLELVPVARITGSVGRAAALDRRFRYRSGQEPRDAPERRRRLRDLFDRGRVPPLELYRIGEDDFVIDGHHRLAIALERGQTEVEARVVEYLPDREDPANAVYYERRAFERATGLHDLRATEPGRYPRLLNRIRDHRHELARQHAEEGTRLWVPTLFAPSSYPIDLHRAARDWYAREYRPVVETRELARLRELFPGRALGDLFGYVSDHRWYMSERRGWDVGIDTALGDFLHRNAPPPGAAARPRPNPAP